ncbi:MAG: hypothetical protein F7B20_02550 [Aeropyrum sp.]|nr:hypothetical protein [Aeropyrum sp.]MCE4616219.1 hypothetical protein [Aeropyrum sp.]
MTVSCYFCADDSRSSCSICSRPICSTHSTNGVCIACHDAICRFCGEQLSVSYCLYCGRLGCIDCLIQIDPSRRVCRECLASMDQRGPSDTSLQAMARIALRVVKI